MCGTYPNFNLALWDKLAPQALIMINLLRKSNLNSNISAYSQLHGAYDFNRISITSLWMRVIVHENPDDRETWAPQPVEGWYIGLAMYHYRC